LTTDSKAIAATMPSCRSVASRWRVPNSSVNAASSSATYSAVSLNRSTACPLGGITTSGYCSRIRKLVDTALSCSAMYGITPTTAITVTSPPSTVLLP